MTDISRLDATSAGQIARKLDTADGTADGKISGSIWNQFAEGKGNKISEDGYITLENAWKSITKYVIREAAKQSKNVEALAGEWLQSLGEAAPAAGADETGNADSTENADNAGDASRTGGANNTEAERKKQIQADYNSVKVHVPPKYMSNASKTIIKNRKSGQAIAAKLKAAKGNLPEITNALKSITKENAAYAVNFPNAVNTIGNRGIIYNNIIKPLVQRAKDLKINVPNEKTLSANMSLTEMQNTIKDLRAKIIAKDSAVVKKDNAEKTEFNKNRGKIQKTFDGANKLLAEVANMNPKPKITSGSGDNGKWKNVTLSDGRWIEVHYDNSGEIKDISISHDTTPDRNSDGSTVDGQEVFYSKNKAWYNNNKNNCDFEGAITSGYNFEKLKALAAKIFG